MPMKSKKPCKHPDCPNLTDGLYCEQHKHLYPDRLSRESRDYTANWRKVRAAYLRKHPLCVKCLAKGKFVEATVVDHIVPHRGDSLLMWDESNFQAACWNDDSTELYDCLIPFQMSLFRLFLYILSSYLYYITSSL